MTVDGKGWSEAARAALDRLPSDWHLRSSMARLWRLTKVCPFPIRENFRSQGDLPFLEMAKDIRLWLSGGIRPAGWKTSGTNDDQGLVRQLTKVAAALSALDDLHSQSASFAGGEVTDAQVTCELGNFGAWIAPMLFTREFSAQSQLILPPLALKKHRIVPMKSECNFDIVVTKAPPHLWQALWPNARRKIKTYAGAFAEGSSVVWDMKVLDTRRTAYLALDVSDRPLRLQRLHAHIDRARKSGAHILVLPELTVPPALQLDAARNSAVKNTDKRRPAIMLLGSFHEVDSDGSNNNIARLFDWSGHELIVQAKQQVFVTNNKSEAITTAKSIKLLMTPLGLIGIAICIDFCQAAQKNVWEELGVDWALVPSLADEKTFKLHKKKASELHAKHGSVSIIAQQIDEPLDDKIGFAAVRDKKLRSGPLCNNSGDTPPALTVSIQL